MRVNRGRLDLGSLHLGRPCTITTGLSSITLDDGHTIQMGLYLKGVGRLGLNDRIVSEEREGGGKSKRVTKWLHLGKLAPSRLYQVELTGWDSEAGPEWVIRDLTPDHEPGPGEMTSGGESWSVLAKLLGRGRR